MSFDVLSAITSRRLHLILLPTEACNFRCVYCYETFQYRRMEAWVVHAVNEFVQRRASDLEHLTISWFGGEPLLARDIVESVMSHVQAVSSEHPGLRVASDATTNGYFLTPETAARLIDLGTDRFQVSFDGPRDLHDRKRVLASGKGTFDRIWDNLRSMRKLPRSFKVTLRVHVAPDNEHRIREFIDDCATVFADDPRYELFLRGLARLGGANDAALSVYGREEGQKVYQELRSYAETRGLRVMAASREDEVCYAARANSFVVRANGRLNKCTVALEHPNNQVGRIRADGTLEVDNARMLMWMRGLQSGDRAELRCPMKGMADVNEATTGRQPITLAVR